MSDRNRGPTGVAEPSRGDGGGFGSDVALSLRRWLRKTLRNPFVTFTSLVQPAIFFVLLAEVFGAVAGPAITSSGVGYVTYLTPAIVVQSALAGAAVSGIGLVKDMESGMFEATLVSPMPRGAVLVGKALSDLLRVVVQTLLVLAFGYGLARTTAGVSPGEFLPTGAAGVAGVLAVTVLFAATFMGFSNVVALVTRDEEATILIANLLTFPLLFLSSAFLPLAVLPGWVRAVAVVNPVTYGVAGVRSAMLGRDTLVAVELGAFGGVWDAILPSALVLGAATLALGLLALHLLSRAAGSSTV